MTLYLLDTDVVLEAYAGKAEGNRTIDVLAGHGVAISAATAGELNEGAFRSSNPQAYLSDVRDVLGPTPVLPFTEPIAERFGEIRAFLYRFTGLMAARRRRASTRGRPSAAAGWPAGPRTPGAAR